MKILFDDLMQKIEKKKRISKATGKITSDPYLAG
tara:strand:+ start:121 stop:222 length:102 start_codon:yes stop_codon:yes gene_type:complete